MAHAIVQSKPALAQGLPSRVGRSCPVRTRGMRTRPPLHRFLPPSPFPAPLQPAYRWLDAARCGSPNAHGPQLPAALLALVPGGHLLRPLVLTAPAAGAFLAAPVPYEGHAIVHCTTLRAAEAARLLALAHLNAAKDGLYLCMATVSSALSIMPALRATPSGKQLANVLI